MPRGRSHLPCGRRQPCRIRATLCSRCRRRSRRLSRRWSMRAAGRAFGGVFRARCRPGGSLPSWWGCRRCGSPLALPSRSARRAVQRLLRSPPARSLRRFLTRPVVCWLAPVAALIGWHVPAVFELGVRSRWWHDLQAASFFATGVLFWLPVVRWRAGVVSASPCLIPVYLFAATLPCDALSAFLVFCDRVVYPSYLSAPRLSSLAPLHDQEFAGALMWVSVTLIYLLPAVVITIELLSPPRTDSIGAARHRAAVERSARKSTDRHASF